MKYIYLVAIRKHIGTNDEEIIKVLDTVYHTREEAYDACIEYEESFECDYCIESASVEEIVL